MGGKDRPIILFINEFIPVILSCLRAGIIVAGKGPSDYTSAGALE